MSKYIMGHRAQTRSAILRYVLILGGTLLLLCVAQVTWLAGMWPFGATPDVMLCAVLGISFFCGRQLGAIYGIAAGFLIEAIGAQGIMLLPIFYLLCGYAVGHLARTATGRVTAYLGYLGALVLLREGVTLVYISLTYQSIHLPQILWQILLPEAAATAICGVILYAPMLWLSRCLEPKKHRRHAR